MAISGPFSLKCGGLIFFSKGVSLSRFCIRVEYASAFHALKQVLNVKFLRFCCIPRCPRVSNTKEGDERVLHVFTLYPVHDT